MSDTQNENEAVNEDAIETAMMGEKESLKEEVEEDFSENLEGIDFSAIENDDSAKIAELENKLKDSEDKYLRVHAEFENIKKRLEREKYNAIDYAQEAFAKDLLPVTDTLELAINQTEANEENALEVLEKFKEGIDLTIKKLNDVFEKHGIELIDCDGEFDPNFHNAVMQVDSDEHESGAIVQKLQKGYSYKSRTLRPAMVSVAK
jgi:molecular chaperone GrpE